MSENDKTKSKTMSASAIVERFTNFNKEGKKLVSEFIEFISSKDEYLKNISNVDSLTVSEDSAPDFVKENEVKPPRRGRGRPRKIKPPEEEEEIPAITKKRGRKPAPQNENNVAEKPPKRKRGRPRKIKEDEITESVKQDITVMPFPAADHPLIKRRGRPRKNPVLPGSVEENITPPIPPVIPLNADIANSDAAANAENTARVPDNAPDNAEVKPAPRKRGRPRKNPLPGLDS